MNTVLGKGIAGTIRSGLVVALVAGGASATAGPEAPSSPSEERALIAQFLDCEAGLASGCEAFRAGEMERAAHEFRGLAEQGIAGAQNNLGVCYETGSGVSESKTDALHWYRSAAGKGLALGQYNLAVLLATEHVLGTAKSSKHRREDLISAYSWLVVAAHQGFERAERTRKDLLLRMTPQEVSEARKQAERRIAKLPNR